MMSVSYVEGIRWEFINDNSNALAISTIVTNNVFVFADRGPFEGKFWFFIFVAFDRDSAELFFLFIFDVLDVGENADEE